MPKVNKSELEKRIAQGFTEELSDGRLGLRFTARMKGRPRTRDRDQWKRVLQLWQNQLAENTNDVGIEVIPSSLSYSGQTTEFLVPVEQLENAMHKLKDQNVEFRLQKDFYAVMKPDKGPNR